jgi:hypothetical protein
MARPLLMAFTPLDSTVSARVLLRNIVTARTRRWPSSEDATPSL